MKDDKFVMSARQAAELDFAFERNGWSPADVKKLSEGDILAHVREVLLGRAELVKAQHIVDCDASPFTPDGWRVEEHRKGGKLILDVSKIKLHLSPNQKGGKIIEGNKLRKELAVEPVLSANVLDYLLANPHLIPRDWKKDERGRTRYIYFWGTIYRNSNGSLCVRFLYFDDGEGDWSCDWLGRGWSDNYPAALLEVD